MRILTARVPARYAGAFERVLREQLPVMRTHAGLVYVKLARQANGAYDDVILFEEWRDAKALYGWTGPNLGTPRLLPGAEGLADVIRVTHYEALDTEPDAVWAGLPADRPHEDPYQPPEPPPGQASY